MTLVYTALSLYLVTSGLSQPAATNEIDIEEHFLKTLKDPSAKNQTELIKRCSGKDFLNFDGSEELVDSMDRVVKENFPASQIQILVAAALHCVDGASAEALIDFLSDDVLLNATGKLIEAIGEEKGLKKLGGLSAFSQDWIDCDSTECQAKEHLYFQRRLSALRRAQIKKQDEKIRQSLINSIENYLKAYNSADHSPSSAPH